MTQLPEEWVWCRLGEICSKPQYGWTTPAKAEGNGPRLLRTTDISSGKIKWGNVPFCERLPEEIDKYRLYSGDILISRAGSVGISVEIDNDVPEAIFASYLIRFRPIESVSGRFISLYLKSPVYWDMIVENVAGIAIPNVNASKLQRLNIPLPPLPEQRLIVYRVEKLLEQVRKAKENLDKIPQIIKRFRQTVLKKAFSGELTAEWREKHPYLEPATELLKRIQEERKKQYEVDHESHENTRKTRKKAEGKKTPKKPRYMDSEPLDNSDLPEEWVWSRLEEMAQINPRHPANIVPEDSEISFVPMPAIDEKSWKFKEMQTRLFGEVRKGYTHFAEGDVLFAKITPCMENGKAAVAKNLVNGIGCGTTELHVIRPEGRILPEFIYHYIHQQFFREKAEARMTGTAGQLRVPVNFVKTASIPLPPLPEQKEIVRRLETLFKFADEVEKKVEKAREQVDRITQSVLSKAFGGELTENFREAVKNWKKLELEERRRYIFTLPEEERKKALYGDKFPLEPGVLLKHIQEKNRKPELVRDGAGTDARPYNLNKLRHPEAKQLTLWDEQS